MMSSGNALVYCGLVQPKRNDFMSEIDSATRMQTQNELLIAVDSQDQVLHSIGKVSAHQGSGTLHRAFTIFLKNSKNEWLITQRSQTKPLWPLWWDGACSSHPWYPNETVLEAVFRRVPFELGIDAEKAKNIREIHSYEYHAVYSPEWSENEINHILVGEYDEDPTPNPSEIADYQWLASRQIKKLLEDPRFFAPWVKQAWDGLIE